MSRRRVALAAVAVVTVLCIVGVSIAAVAAGGQAIAYSVNGARVSQSAVDGQLDDLAHADATHQVSGTAGSIDSKATAQVLTLRIARDLLQDAAARRGVEVTDADRAAAEQAVGAQLQGYPSSYVDLVVDLQATGQALGLQTSDDVNAFVVEQFRRADVHVNPRYGTWNPRVGVCPPSGCAGAASPAQGG